MLRLLYPSNEFSMTFLLECFQIPGSMQIFNLFSKKKTAKLKAIIDRFRCYLFVEKSWKKLYLQLYAFLNANNLLSKNQSGFRPGDSTISQLLSITSSIYEAFENYEETRAVFLDISKAFDKVWHEGLIYKLKCNGITGKLLTFFENYLSQRCERVVLNGKESEWTGIKAGVPQGSVLGPLLF